MSECIIVIRLRRNERALGVKEIGDPIAVYPITKYFSWNARHSPNYFMCKLPISAKEASIYLIKTSYERAYYTLPLTQEMIDVKSRVDFVPIDIKATDIRIK